MVPTKPGLYARVAGKVCDLIEGALLWVFRKSIEESHFLQGNFAPTGELGPVTDLPVLGTLPDCLNGEFVRNGPNPKFKPVANYHWFDGDGMLHGLRMKNGSATYVSRYIRTSKLIQNEYYGAEKFVRFGDMIKGVIGLMMILLSKLRVRLGVLDASLGTGTANTALVYHNRKLMALLEADKPYVIRMLEDGNLETLGILDYNKRLSHFMTAHPKVDPATGEMFFFCYKYESPYCIYSVVSKDGYLHDPVPITIPEPVMMHDFAITENYAIFMDLPLIFRPQNMAKKKMVFEFDSSKNSRFGVLPRYAVTESQVQWFELPPCFIFHTANAWEDGNEVVLIACRMPKFELQQLEEVMELYEFRFNLKTGNASQRPLSKGSVDFCRINDNYVGRKHEYVYASVFDGKRIKGVVKFNLSKEPNLGKENLTAGGNVEGIYVYGENRFGSEAVFVPKSSEKDTEEDDGFLITFVHDETMRKSEVIVIDAKTMAAEPVAVIKLPARVPYGFHAIFVNDEQLQNQL